MFSIILGRSPQGYTHVVRDSLFVVIIIIIIIIIKEANIYEVCVLYQAIYMINGES